MVGKEVHVHMNVEMYNRLGAWLGYTLFAGDINDFFS